MNSLEEIADVLSKCKKVVMCGHSIPDGDSVGSVLAMKYLLSGIGVECYLPAEHGFPALFRFLPGAEDTLKINNLPKSYDAAVILDCTDLGRLGDDLEKFIRMSSKIINIDHHVSNHQFGQYNYVDSNASATGEIVFELVKLLDQPLTREIAENIYSAIVMDTGSYRYENTTDKTHRITAELVKTGIDVAGINRNLFEKKDVISLKILGYALNVLSTSDDKKVAWVTLPYKEMHEMGVRDEHAEGIINYPRMLQGVEVGLLFREITPDRFKVGFRSNSLVDVNKLASVFGGGGHPRASGCLIEGCRQQVEKKVIDLCLDEINKR
jgi:phosphoesterase RecJ-like protein